MRFVLLQNGLKDRHTHFYNETMGWLDACQRRGHQVKVYTHKLADPVVLMETGGVPVFSFKLDANPSNGQAWSRRQTFLLSASGYAKTLGSISPGIGAEDVVVVPYSTDWQVYGIAQWLESIPLVARPRIVFIFHLPNLNWMPDRKSVHLQGDFSNIRQAFSHLKGVTSPETVLCLATNRALCRELVRVLGVPFSICPVPISYSEANVLKGPAEGRAERAHVGVMGEFRLEKGALLVADTLEQFNQARPGKTMFVQNNYSGTTAAPGLEKLHHLDIDKMTVFDGEMSPPDYADRLNNIDIFLLPYQRERYLFRISAIFAEAVAYGAVVVVPDQTWMAAQLENGFGAGVVFETTSAPDICRALMEASDRFPELSEKAQASAAEWRRTQCTDALVEYVISRQSA